MPRSAATSRRQLVSWPLYRLLAVIALVPVLVAALTVREPSLPPPPAQPLAPFDGSAAATTAAAMVTLPRQQNGRGPGSAGDLAAAAWVRSQLEQAGYHVSTQTFAADLPDQANVPMQNVIGYLPGRRPDVIAVFAHHDGLGTGVDDNAAAVGVMLELAKELQPLARERGLLFVSTDGGTSGGQGATYFAEHSPFARRISSAISLDSLAAKPGSPLRIVIRPDTVRGTSPTLFRTARAVASRVTGRSPDVPGVLDQLSGLAVPYALGEQGPLIARGVPALTLSAGPPPDPAAAVSTLSPAQLGAAGSTVANLVEQLDAAPSIEPGGRPDIFIGSRTMQGWLAEMALVALFAPALVATLDMTARVRRRHLPLAPAARALSWRMAAWCAFLVALWVLPFLPGNLASGLSIAPRPNDIGISWAGIGLAVLAGLAMWRFVTRPRLTPERPIGGADRTGGLVAGLLGLNFAATLLVAVNPFALILVLPAAHIWLLLPSAARLGRRYMLVVYLLGFSGPLLLVLEYATRFHLGLSTPRALLAMTASGYLSPVVAVCFTLATASAAQVGSVITGRYSPAHAPDRGYN
ncbi:MAG TPA: M28 family peptidase [Gaiellales bacterium]|nr:M28 family peptidase [Gaiellales bacterium]